MASKNCNHPAYFGCLQMISKDTVRTIRWEPSKIWVDVLEMPIYRLKSDKNQPNPQLYQAKHRRR